MARKHLPVKTPFYSGPTKAVMEHKAQFVTIAETSHRRYEVWLIPASLVHKAEKEAQREEFCQAV